MAVVLMLTRQQVAEPREVAMLEETSIEQVVPAREVAAVLRAVSEPKPGTSEQKALELMQVSEQVVAFFQE